MEMRLFKRESTDLVERFFLVLMKYSSINGGKRGKSGREWDCSGDSNEHKLTNWGIIHKSACWRDVAQRSHIGSRKGEGERRKEPLELYYRPKGIE